MWLIRVCAVFSVLMFTTVSISGQFQKEPEPQYSPSITDETPEADLSNEHHVSENSFAVLMATHEMMKKAEEKGNPKILLRAPQAALLLYQPARSATNQRIRSNKPVDIPFNSRVKFVASPPVMPSVDIKPQVYSTGMDVYSDVRTLLMKFALKTLRRNLNFSTLCGSQPYGDEIKRFDLVDSILATIQQMKKEVFIDLQNFEIGLVHSSLSPSELQYNTDRQERRFVAYVIKNLRDRFCQREDSFPIDEIQI